MPRKHRIQSNDPINLKCLCVGDTYVGKTCLYYRYAKDIFPEKYIPSVFEGFVADHTIGNRDVNIALWDTGGTKIYRPLLKHSYTSTSILLLCYSVDNRKSFINAEEDWKVDLNKHFPSIPVLLVGTKTDLRDDTKRICELRCQHQKFVSVQEGLEMASRISAVGYVECSTLLGEGVHEVFDLAARIAWRYEIFQKKEAPAPSKSSTLSVPELIGIKDKSPVKLK